MQTSEPTDDLRQNVHEDEELYWVVRARQGARLAGKIPSSVFSGVIAGGLVGTAVWAVTRDDIMGVLGFLIVLALFVGFAVLSVYTYNIEYAATNHRLMSYHGRFGRNLTSVPVAGIQDAEYTISAIENIFDVGTVSIDTDRGYETMRFPKVPDPEDFAREIVSLAQSDKSGE